jgi:hypothetical protein
MKIEKCSPKHAGLCHLRRGLTIARCTRHLREGARQDSSESESAIEVISDR